MTPSIVEVRGLTVGWGGEVILRDLDFTVETGEVFLILGGSGSGKSTLLRHLIGLARPMKGSIRILAEDAHSPAPGYGPPPFGVLFQSGALFGSMTLEQNVSLPLRKWTPLLPQGIRIVARSKLRLVGLEGFENHLPSEISGGQRKRAGIARALALDPQLLFLDEPSAGLDPATSAELDDLITTLSSCLGVTMVIVTHELASILKIGRSCILLDGGTKGIIARGNPRELAERSSDPRVMRYFHPVPVKAGQAGS
ncbi:MAG: ABC transporter ATP-binding protein [Planctomycetota bacterium]